MNTGRFIAVVGPSGVGKDSVMQGIKAVLPNIHLVRRIITRDPNAGGEDFDAVSETAFARLSDEAAFALSWRAHGLSYGIPSDVNIKLSQGVDCLANLSRGALAEAADQFEAFKILHITADRDILVQRLAGRGREGIADIERRLAQAVKPIPAGFDVIEIANNDTLEEAVDRAVVALQAPKA